MPQRKNKVEVISCSNGHRFPLNRKKHEHETHVLCPKCKGEVQIRKKILRFPNPEWPKIKLHNAADRVEIKRKATEKPERPMIPYLHTPVHAQSAGLLALSMMMAKKELESRGERVD